MRKSKLAKSDAGFGMIEILISLLILSVFFMISGQGLMISTVFRVEAERKQRANLLIEEDINQARYQALNISKNIDPDSNPSDKTKCSLDTITTTNNYGKDLIGKLNPSTTVEILKKKYTLQRNFKDPSGIKKNVVEIYYEIKDNITGKVIANNGTKVDVDLSPCGSI